MTGTDAVTAVSTSRNDIEIPRADVPREWSPVVRSEAGSTQSSHVAIGRLDILFANSQFRNILEWEDPTARSEEPTKAGTER